MKKISFIIILLFATSPAFSEFETGNTLFNKLSISYPTRDTSTNLDYVFAWGYLTGVFDAWSHILFSPPAGVTSGQIRDLVTNYLEKHPESRHESASSLVLTAFQEAFPLKKKEIEEKKKAVDLLN